MTAVFPPSPSADLSAVPAKADFPRSVKTRYGCSFDPNLAVWSLADPRTKQKLDFTTLPPLRAEFFRAIKATLIWFVQQHSLSYAGDIFRSIRKLLRMIHAGTPTPIAAITSVDLLNYREAIGARREGNFVKRVVALLKKMYALGYAGVTPDAVALMSAWVLARTPKGEAVLTRCPRNGPLTHIELEAVLQALNDAYAQQKVSGDFYTLAWCAVSLGMRNAQFAAARVCDLEIGDQHGAVCYTLNLPRAKQGNGARDEFKRWHLTPEVGRLVAQQAAAVRKAFADVLADPTQAPLFPRAVDAPDETQPPGWEYHHRGPSLGERIAYIMSGLRVVSERTGEFIHIHSKRFRNTMGTRAAEEGHGERIIAELLDHTGLTSARIYTAATAPLMQRLDKAMAHELAPRAQAFAGKLIVGPTDASPGAKLIRASNVTSSDAPMANCSRTSKCALLKPVGCYTCRSFEPWLDGPHEQVLEFLLAERERLLMSSDAQIAKINDRTILAVTDVIQRCAAVRAERSNA